MKDIAAVGHLGPRAAASAGWPRNGACDATAAERHAFDRANQAALTLAFLGSHGSHPVGSHPRHTAKKHSTRKWGTVLFGAGGGTPRPKRRRKRRLASEWRLRARISPNVGSRPPWQTKKSSTGCSFCLCLHPRFDTRYPFITIGSDKIIRKTIVGFYSSAETKSI